MAKNLNRIDPTLFEFPIQSNRTGWHPVWTPTLLVVPWSFDVNGNRIEGSRVNSVTFAIENIREITVGGHPQQYDPLGTKPQADPDAVIFQVTLTYSELLEYQIDLSTVTFYDQDGNITDNPEEGDWIEFTNARGIQSRLEYLPDAEYFDLSYVQIDVDNLPSNRYIASWTVDYFKRIDRDGALFCIDENTEKSIKLDYLVNHPGEIHEEMVKRTPAVYIEDIDKKQDFTVNLYRPFADILQNIFDESELFHGINWVNKIPPQLFPYLSHLIGVELPTRTGGASLDKIRRRMLERGAELQKLKGSELAIKELFSILGFVINITNLWASVDGTRFIAPNESDPDPAIKPEREEINLYEVSQTDPLVANYVESGFGNIEVPLLHRNNNDSIVLSAYIVGNDTQAHDDLSEIITNLIDDPNYFANDTIIHDADSYLMIPEELRNIGDGIEAFSRIVVSDIEVLSQSHVGLPVLRFDGVRYNKLRDVLDITFADYKDLSNRTLYIFGTYVRNEFEIPEILKNNQTNRFDIEILAKNGEVIESGLYDYLLDSLFKFKAFHSLLRKVSYTAPLRYFYNVIDFCNNAFLSQESDADANSLMVPPACPTDECFLTNECNEQNARGGLRQDDKEVRNIILEGLKEEYDRWNDITDDWLNIDNDKLEWAKSKSNISIPVPDNEGDNFGQDRVSYDLVVQLGESSNNPNINVGDVIYMRYMGTYLESVSSTEPIIFNIQSIKYQILSELTGVEVKIEIARQFTPNSFYVSMEFDVDHDTDIRSKIAELNTLSTPDYCYKGRVRDFISFKNEISLNEYVRNRPCNLMMGRSVYYRINSDILENKVGWHDKLLDKSDLTLHYSNSPFWNDINKSHIRLSSQIDKIGLGFPSHRPMRFGLINDFTHPTYEMRPWDIDDGCFEFSNQLNARLIDVGGVERLVFDDVDLVYDANGIPPDIDQFNGQSSATFTHSIYSTTENRPFIELDNTEYTDQETMFIDEPIFDSTSSCFGTDGREDFSDGYPASSGDFQFTASDIWSGRMSGSDYLIEPDVSDGLYSASAKFSSQLKVLEPEESPSFKVYNGYDLWKGYRFDCSCSTIPCSGVRLWDIGVWDEGQWDEQFVTGRTCDLDFFRDRDGKYDSNNDHLEIDKKISHEETIKAETKTLDGSIDNFINWDFEEGQPKKLRFRDDYGIFYQMEIESSGHTYDIQYETFQPRVWGEDSGGYVEDGKVYREGILTTVRQIYVLINGEWELSAEGTNQEVVYRQTNYTCDFPMPEDRFIYRTEHMIRDEVEMLVKCGPHWVDPEANTNSVWSDGSISPTEDICADQPFAFVDVWGDND